MAKIKGSEMIHCSECEAELIEWKTDEGRIWGIEGFMCLGCKMALCPQCANDRHFKEDDNDTR